MIELIGLLLLVAFVLEIIFDGPSEFPLGDSSRGSSCPCGGRGYWPIANDRGSFPACQLCRGRG
jgi:hypothetical protein